MIAGDAGRGGIERADGESDGNRADGGEGDLAGEQRDVTWGSQIRSYVLHPYQQVKDLRSDLEVGNVDAVLDGDLDALMEAFLQWQRSQRHSDS